MIREEKASCIHKVAFKSLLLQTSQAVLPRINLGAAWKPTTIGNQVYDRFYIVEGQEGEKIRRKSTNMRPTQAEIIATPNEKRENKQR